MVHGNMETPLVEPTTRLSSCLHSSRDWEGFESLDVVPNVAPHLREITNMSQAQTFNTRTKLARSFAGMLDTLLRRDSSSRDMVRLGLSRMECG